MVFLLVGKLSEGCIKCLCAHLFQWQLCLFPLDFDRTFVDAHYEARRAQSLGEQPETLQNVPCDFLRFDTLCL